MKAHLPVLLALVALAGCDNRQEAQPTAAAAPSESDAAGETARLNVWLDDEFAEYLDFSPLSKTQLGDKSDYDKLDDASEAAEDRLLEWRRASVQEMKATFDRSRLTEEGKVSWDLWVYLLDRAEQGVPFRRHWFIFGRSGAQAWLPNDLINYHKVDTPADMAAYVSRLNASGHHMRQFLERARLAAADGIRAPYFDYDLAITQARRVITGAPFDDGTPSAIWQDVTGKIAALAEAGQITEDEAAQFTGDARQALLGEFKPAYDEIIAWLEADRPNTSTEAQGAWALPNGEAYYDHALSYMTTLPLTADEIHQIGLAEVARIRKEMEAIKEKVGFEGSLQEFFAFMRESDQFYYPSTDEGREAYLQLARDYLDKIKVKLPQYFGILPKADLEVRRVEAFREQAGGAAHYARGTPDGSRPGVFYAHLIDMRAAGVYRLQNLAYHEGIPGHHLQISIQQELPNLPRFRTYHGYTAFSEGWGLYAERLARDMGFYEDPYSDFGRLSGEIWRAVRLVVDTGIHAKHWTEQQAIDYALENSPRPAAAVESEIRRYFNNPGQATAYKIGMLKILELRERAMQQLGDRFDYRTFHDAVLGSGALPLPVLEQNIDRWIAAQKPGGE